MISVPAGRYTLDTAIFPADRSDRWAAPLVQPVLEVTGDATIVLDARVVCPNALSVSDATAGSLLESARPG